MKSGIHISLFVCLFFVHINISAQTIQVTLLGTGTPQPSIERFGAATLVEAGGNYFYLIAEEAQPSVCGNKKLGLEK